MDTSIETGRHLPGALESTVRRLLHPYSLFALVALLVWWRDGFNAGPTDDGWLGLVQASHQVVFTNRVFGELPRLLGLRLTPGSFVGWQAILFLLTVLRCVLMFEVVRRLVPRHALFALACGLLTLFQPADRIYFGVDYAGIELALVLSLASALCALQHLQGGSRVSLLAMLAFQFVSCFTYTAFLLVAIGLPTGGWILRRLQGGRDPVWYLFKVNAVMFLFIAFQAYLSFHGKSHEGVVMDLDARGVLAGYGYAAGMLWRAWPALLSGVRLDYLPLAALMGAFTYGTVLAWGSDSQESGAGLSAWRYYAVAVAGFLGLAALSYLPYAVSDVRFDNARQLMAAGMFAYMAVLLPVFVLLPRHPYGRHASYLILALLAASMLVSGYEIRDRTVGVYRMQERLLAAVAAVVPDPPSGALILVHLGRPYQVHVLEGMEHRWGTFDQALGFMYGDDSLRGGFTDLYNGAPFAFDREGVTVNTSLPVNQGRHVPYGKLILVDYLPDGSARILGRDWLQQFAPKGTDLSAYQPGDYGRAPGADAVTCRLLEKQFRPAYCE